MALKKRNRGNKKKGKLLKKNGIYGGEGGV